MRFVCMAMFLLLSACINQQQAPQAPNETSQSLQDAGPSSALPAQQIPILGNITAIPEAAAEPDLNAPAGETANQTPDSAANQTGNTADSGGNALAQPPPIPEGILFGNSSYLLVLDDVSIVPVSDEPCGIFSIRHSANGSVLERMFICPGDSQYYHDDAGKEYRIFVVKAASGYTEQEKWASVLIFQ